MTKKIRLMRADPDFYNFCRNIGICSDVTKELSKEQTILSEMLDNEDFKKEIHDLFRRIKNI